MEQGEVFGGTYPLPRAKRRVRIYEKDIYGPANKTPQLMIIGLRSIESGELRRRPFYYSSISGRLYQKYRIPPRKIRNGPYIFSVQILVFSLRGYLLSGYKQHIYFLFFLFRV